MRPFAVALVAVMAGLLIWAYIDAPLCDRPHEGTMVFRELNCRGP